MTFCTNVHYEFSSIDFGKDGIRMWHKDFVKLVPLVLIYLKFSGFFTLLGLNTLDFPLFYRIFLQFKQFLWKLFSTYQLIWCTSFVSLFLSLSNINSPPSWLRSKREDVNIIFFLNNIFTSCGELKMLTRSKNFIYW